MTTSLERTLRGGCQVLYLQGGPSGQSAKAPPPSASAVCKQPALDEPKMLPFKKRRESKRGGGSSSDCVVQPAGCRRRLSTRATSEPVDERPPAILLLFGGRVGSEDGAAEALRTRPVPLHAGTRGLPSADDSSMPFIVFFIDVEYVWHWSTERRSHCFSAR